MALMQPADLSSGIESTFTDELKHLTISTSVYHSDCLDPAKQRFRSANSWEKFKSDTCTTKLAQTESYKNFYHSVEKSIIRL